MIYKIRENDKISFEKYIVVLGYFSEIEFCNAGTFFSCILAQEMAKIE